MAARHSPTAKSDPVPSAVRRSDARRPRPPGLAAAPFRARHPHRAADHRGWSAPGNLFGAPPERPVGAGAKTARFRLETALA
jgi:hypothetical protein